MTGCTLSLDTFETDCPSSSEATEICSLLSPMRGTVPLVKHLQLQTAQCFRASGTQVANLGDTEMHTLHNKLLKLLF